MTPGRRPRVELLIRDRRSEGDRQAVDRDLDRPSRRIVGPGRRARPAIGHLHRERIAIEVVDRSVRVHERPVDEWIAAVGIADEREAEVRAVVEVHREPVPAAASHGDEVAPLVVEPGGPVHVHRSPVEREGAVCGHRRSRVVVRPPGRPEVDPTVVVVQRGRLWSASGGGRGRGRPDSRLPSLRRVRAQQPAGPRRRPRPSSRPFGRTWPGRSGPRR